MTAPHDGRTVLMVGAGGHARVLVDSLRRAGVSVAGFLAAEPSLQGRKVAGLPVIGGDECLAGFPTESVLLANGIGSVDVPTRRREAFERLAGAGYAFMRIVDPTALICGDVETEDGVQVLAGAIVQTGARLGRNVVVNTGAIVEHDCVVEAHCHIATGARLGGAVVVEAGCHIGSGATVIQGIRIGAGALVAAGAVVAQDVPPAVRVRGTPARVF
jgi:sugar O-acyltransferase (sialic acid O-acetyltransferase NeuD family)